MTRSTSPDTPGAGCRPHAGLSSPNEPRDAALGQLGAMPPSPHPPVHPGRWQFGAAGLLALIFALDLSMTLGTAVPVLYVLPTLLFVWAGRLKEPLVVAAAATVLTVAGLVLSRPGGAVEHGLINRVIAVALVWITAALVVSYLHAVERWRTQMESANRALQETVRQLTEVQHALDQSAIVATTDQRGVITAVNDKFCEISKYSRHELLGQDHRIINSGYHPKDFIRELWRTIAQGRIWQGELRNRAKDGSIYWVDTTIVPFLDERGKPRQYLAIRSDITKRKAAEQTLRDQAALTQLGRLSAVVAHEVRNPLAAIKGSLQVLASRLPPDFPGRDVIPPVMARIDALNGTLSDILNYSRPRAPKRQRFDLQPVIAEVTASARAVTGGPPIDVVGPPIVVSADPEMTRAVLLNLFLNACQASNGRPVEARTRVEGERCEIAILDRGPGLPQQVRDHLFEPFVTTRPGGTGLGLAIARRLTGLQGGALVIEDRPGGGTRAVVTLPRSDRDSVPEVAAGIGK